MKTKLFTKRSRINAPAETVFKWHARQGAIQRLSPPWDPLKVIRHTGGIDVGAEVIMRLKAGPIQYNWHARHVDYAQNRMFTDIQIKGPFARWEHTHLFELETDDSSILEDSIEYELPAHPAGSLLLKRFIQRRLKRIFTYRHHTTNADISLFRKFPEKKPLHILVSGSSGLIGSSLVPFLSTGGHRVTRLVRRLPLDKKNEIYWNPEAGALDPASLEGIDAVIHLAGENIGRGRWTVAKKRRILESRVRGTVLLAETISKMTNPPEVLICASAIGYYGNRGDLLMTETDAPGNDFISEVCKQWEDAAAPAVKKGIRAVFARIGIVLSPQGGALARLLPVFQLGIGGRIASGSQYMSWLGIDDVLGAIYHALADDHMRGPVNLVSPNPVTNAEFSATLGKVLVRPAVCAVPKKAIELVFGEMGKETVLSSTRVEPAKLNEVAGYHFRHPELEGALRHLLGRI